MEDNLTMNESLSWPPHQPQTKDATRVLFLRPATQSKFL